MSEETGQGGDEVLSDEEQKALRRKMVEAALFAAGKPLSVEEVSDATGLGKRHTSSALKALVRFYGELDSAITVSKAGEKYSMHIRPEFSTAAEKVAPGEIPQKVLKTAAIIGYYQPIKQSDLVNMIGPKAYDHIAVLKEFGLITTRKTGQTKMIRITDRFAEYFGIGTTDPEGIRDFLASQLGIKRKKKNGSKRSGSSKKKK